MLYNDATETAIASALKDTFDVREQLVMIDDTVAEGEVTGLVTVYADGTVIINAIDAELNATDFELCSVEDGYLTIAYRMLAVDRMTEQNMHLVRI